MTKTYRAAVALLNGDPRPIDVDRTVWHHLNARKRRGALFISRKVPLVWRQADFAHIADALAAGDTPTFLIQGGFPKGDVHMVERVWKSKGSPLMGEHQHEDQPSSLTPIFDAIKEAYQDKERFNQDVVNWFSEGDGKGILDLFKGFDGIIVPSFYLSIRKDDDQHQPLEVSFGMTAREKIAPSTPTTRD